MSDNAKIVAGIIIAIFILSLMYTAYKGNNKPAPSHYDNEMNDQYYADEMPYNWR